MTEWRSKRERGQKTEREGERKCCRRSLASQCTAHLSANFHSFLTFIGTAGSASESGERGGRWQRRLTGTWHAGKRVDSARAFVCVATFNEQANEVAATAAGSRQQEGCMQQAVASVATSDMGHQCLPLPQPLPLALPLFCPALPLRLHKSFVTVFASPFSRFFCSLLLLPLFSF